jgi:hypothetical protein
MRSAVGAGNRLALTLVGLLLLAAGVAGLVLSFGGFGSGAAGSPLVPERLRSVVDDSSWFWWAALVACLLIALLGLRWLLSLLRPDRASGLDLTRDPREGITTVHAGALTAAIEQEASSIRGVVRASANLREDRGHELDLVVKLRDNADIADARTALEEQLVPHFRQAVGQELPVDIELRPGRDGGRRQLL